MADILIKNMEMPKSCYSEVYSENGYCPFHFFSTRDGSQCSISPCKCLKTRRPKDCPLIPVPEHGDLVQLDDALDCFSEDDVVARKALRKIPVILERTT